MSCHGIPGAYYITSEAYDIVKLDFLFAHASKHSITFIQEAHGSGFSIEQALPRQFAHRFFIYHSAPTKVVSEFPNPSPEEMSDVRGVLTLVDKLHFLGWNLKFETFSPGRVSRPLVQGTKDQSFAICGIFTTLI